MAAKSSLMVELVKTKEQLENLKRHYTNRVKAMEDEIRHIQQERDKYLESFSSVKDKTEEEKHEIVAKYESKLRSLQQRLEENRVKLRENQRMAAVRAKDDAKIRELQTEINNMKRQKTAISKRMMESGQCACVCVYVSGLCVCVVHVSLMLNPSLLHLLCHRTPSCSLYASLSLFGRTLSLSLTLSLSHLFMHSPQRRLMLLSLSTTQILSTASS